MSQGRYDAFSESVMMVTDADAVVLIVAGKPGTSGFSVTMKAGDPRIMPALCQSIRQVVDQMEADWRAKH